MHWYMILTTSVGIAVIFGLMCFLFHSLFHKLKCYFLHTTNANTATQAPCSPSQFTLQDANEWSIVNAEQEVIFTAYLIRAAN